MLKIKKSLIMLLVVCTVICSSTMSTYASDINTSFDIANSVYTLDHSPTIAYTIRAFTSLNSDIPSEYIKRSIY